MKSLWNMAPIPTKVTGVKLDTFYPNINSANISWNKKAAASGYQYYIYKSDGKTKLTSGYCTYNSISISDKMKINNYYRIKVRAYRVINGYRVYGSWSTTRCISGGSKTVSLSKKTGKLSMSWSKVYGATSYSVYVSRTRPSTGSLSGMTRVKTTTSRSCYISKLNGSRISSSKTYYVVVIANKKVGTTTYRSTPYYFYSR